jgi:hypothetical protein
MQKELLKGFSMLVVILSLALATAVAAANAQSSNKVVADIPFEFSVGYKTMPAGEYGVKAVNSSGNALMIQSADGKLAAVRLSDVIERSKRNSHARLVFHRYGERYFLAEVWTGIDQTGRQLLKSQEERSIERELASIAANGESPKNTYETIEVVASLR